MQRSAVIEGCGLEEQSTALAVSSHDVVDGSMTLLRAQRLERPTAALGYPIHERLSSDRTRVDYGIGTTPPMKM